MKRHDGAKARLWHRTALSLASALDVQTLPGGVKPGAAAALAWQTALAPALGGACALASTEPTWHRAPSGRALGVAWRRFSIANVLAALRTTPLRDGPGSVHSLSRRAAPSALTRGGTRAMPRATKQPSCDKSCRAERTLLPPVRRGLRRKDKNSRREIAHSAFTKRRTRRSWRTTYSTPYATRQATARQRGTAAAPTRAAAPLQNANGAAARTSGYAPLTTARGGALLSARSMRGGMNVAVSRRRSAEL